MNVFRTGWQNDADLTGGQSLIFGQPALDDGCGRFAFSQCIPDGENREAVVHGRDRRRRVQKMPLDMTGKDRGRRAANLVVSVNVV